MSEIFRPNESEELQLAANGLQRFTEGATREFPFGVPFSLMTRELKTNKSKDTAHATAVPWHITARTHSSLPHLLFAPENRCFECSLNEKVILLLQTNAEGSTLDLVASDGSIPCAMEFILVKAALAQAVLPSVAKRHVRSQPWKSPWHQRY